MTAVVAPKRTTQRTINYYYFPCDTKKCKRDGKSIRGKVIFDFIFDFLRQNSFTTEEVYDAYKKKC